MAEAEIVERPRKSQAKRRRDAAAVDETIVTPVLQIGDEVPNFQADSTVGMFDFHDLIDGSFAVLVTFTGDMDPVGTTEIGMLSKLMMEFRARDTKLVAVSIGSKENHRKWIEEIQELQDCRVWFPIVADKDGEVSRLFNLVKPKAVNAKKNLKPATLVTVIDIDRRIRQLQFYPKVTGRNFYETIRSLDALQLSLFHQVVVPANWMQGEEVYVHPGLSSVVASSMFPKGFNELNPWYRPTPQPDV